MADIDNPFIISGYIPDKYFCDREKETEWLVSLVTNGNNVVLISPRRMGKTSLVEHCYQLSEIKDKYYTFYIDILPTTSLAEMVHLLSKRIYETLVPRGTRILKNFLSTVKSLSGIIGYDNISGMPTFTLTVGAIRNPELTLEEIFAYLAKADKRCIVTIDEFQQITRYPEKNIEETLRSRIQKIQNCNFIFAGSERHVMQQMFRDASRPFYNSTEIMELEVIPREKMSEFIVRNFNDFNKTIQPSRAEEIYDLMEGNTFYVQRLSNRAFANTRKGKECTDKIIGTALTQLLEINATYFKERLSLVPASQKGLLYAIARAGSCDSIFSADFIQSNKLLTASSVQNSARQLVAQGLLTVSGNTYTVSDKLLAIYIRRYF